MSQVRYCDTCGKYREPGHEHPPNLWDAVEAEVDELFRKNVLDDPQPVADEEGEQAVASAAQDRDERTLQSRFEQFHEENPDVYRLLVQFARDLRARGYEHAGVKMIWERMRWEMAIQTEDPDRFKLNNDYTSRYARLIMAQERDLFGFFRTRELRAF